MERYEVIKVEDNILLLDLYKLALSSVEAGDLTDLPTLTMEERQEFLAKAKKYYQRQQESMKLSEITLIMTYNCNFACQYCYQREIPHRNQDWSMPEEYIDQIFELTQQLDTFDDFTVRISGGEPLLLENRQLLERVFEHADKNNYKIKLNTNGYTLTDYAPLIKEYSHLMTTITLSLDGMTSVQSERRRLRSGEEYSAEKIIRGIEAIADYAEIIVNTTIDEHNLRDFDQIIGFIKSELIDRELVNLVRVAPASKYQSNYQYDLEEQFVKEIPVRLVQLTQEWSAKDREKMLIYSKGCFRLEQIFKSALGESKQTVYPKFGCTPLGRLTFDPYGDIYFCDLFMGHEEGKLGRYIPELKFNDNYDRLLNRSVFTIDKCLECKYIFLCGSGCPYNALCQEGDPLQAGCKAFAGKYRDALFNDYAPAIIKGMVR